MNRVGMVVDCSHSAYRTTMEAMELRQAPVIFSHSNARKLCTITSAISATTRSRPARHRRRDRGQRAWGCFLGPTAGPSTIWSSISTIWSIWSAPSMSASAWIACRTIISLDGLIAANPHLLARERGLWPGRLRRIASRGNCPRSPRCCCDRGYAEKPTSARSWAGISCASPRRCGSSGPQRAVKPPSTAKACPVVQAAASEAR